MSTDEEMKFAFVIAATEESPYWDALTEEVAEATWDEWIARVRRDTLTTLADHWDETVSEHAERPLFSASGTHVRHYRDTLYPSRESGDHR